MNLQNTIKINEELNATKNPVDSKNTSFALQTIHQAIQKENANLHDEAFYLYLAGYKALSQAHQKETDKEIQKSMKSKLQEVLYKLKYLRGVIAGVPLQVLKQVVWEDVIGLHQVKEELKVHVILPMKFPQFFKEKNPGIILIYGASGSGKTHLIDSVLSESDCSSFTISRNSFSNSNEDLYQKASKYSIILFKELDLLCKKEEFDPLFTQLEAQISNSNMKLIAVTESPWDLSDDLLRRAFYVPLPGPEDRTALFQKFVQLHPHQLTKDHFKQLGEFTAGYSSADVYRIVRDIQMIPMRKAHETTHFKIVNVPSRNNPEETSERLVCCSEDDPNAIKKDRDNIRNIPLLESPITFDDFCDYLITAKPTIDFEWITKYLKFQEHFKSL